jgi:hypothetical protein
MVLDLRHRIERLSSAGGLQQSDGSLKLAVLTVLPHLDSFCCVAQEMVCWFDLSFERVY